MPFSFNPRFLFKKRKIRITDNASPSCYFSKSCSSDGFGNKDTETRIFKDNFFTKKPIKEQQVNVSVEVDSLIETHQKSEQVFKNECIAKSNPDLYSKTSKELTQVISVDESSRIRTTKIDHKGKEVCLCSNRTYSDSETQTEEIERGSNLLTHQEDLSKNKNSSSFSLSHLVKYLKTACKTNFSIFGKKFDKQMSTNKTSDMEQEFENFVPLEINYIGIMREDQTLPNIQTRNHIIHSFDSGVDNSALSSFDSLMTSESMQYDDSVLDYDQINLNRPMLKDVSLNSKTISRTKSLKDIPKSREFDLLTDVETRNNYNLQGKFGICSDNKTFTEQQLKTTNFDTNFNIVKNVQQRESSTNSFNRVASLDNELIFHFNTDYFLDDVSSTSSDSDEVFIRPRKTDYYLDRGIQITDSCKNSRNCNLSKNYYQSEEYIHPPPPSPENLSCHIYNCSETVQKCYHGFANPKLKYCETDINSGGTQTDYKMFTCSCEEINHKCLDCGNQYYSTKFSNEFKKKFSDSKNINSARNIFRPGSYGSSGYESPEQGLGYFPKNPLQINCNDKTLSDTEAEYKSPMEFTKSTFNEFRPLQMASGKYEQLYRSRSEPVNSEQFYTTNAKKSFYDNYNLYNQIYFNEIYPTYVKKPKKAAILDYRNMCREENVRSNSKGMSLKDHLYEDRMTIPKQQISDKTSSLSSLECSENKKQNLFQNSYKFKPENSPNNDNEFYFHSRERKSSFQEELLISDTDESEFTIYKFYGFIDGPLANTSPKRNP